LCLAALLGLLGSASALAQNSASMEINVLYVEQRVERPPVLSNLVSWPEDDGLQGALLGISDNNTTGKFLKQNYSLDELIFQPDQTPDVVFSSIVNAVTGGSRLVVLNLPTDLLVRLAKHPEAQDDVFFNAQSTDNDLRQEQCQANVFHTMASRSMLSDALIQFFNRRQWKRIFLIEGNRAADQALAASMRQSVKKFGLDIVQDKQWLEDADMRRTASTEVPVFTQARRYDAVVVTDEDRDFAQYVLYNTWLPRPVAGSAGLTPKVWSPVIEQWGAAQLQSRFVKQAARDMSSRDYANWAAIRAIGEAVTRTGAAEPAVLKNYLLSDDFELAGFKGTSLSFRTWNGITK